MSASITEPTRKNVSTQFEAQAATEVSSTVGGQSVTFTINRPNKFQTPTVSDAQELDDILSTALIHFKSDGNGFEAGREPDTWTNNGTGGSTYDAIDVRNTVQENATPSPTASNPPPFEVSGHPFSTHGALKFDSVSTGKSPDSDSLRLTRPFTQTDSFVLFLVAHEASQASGNSRGMAGTPFCFFVDEVVTPDIQQDRQAKSALVLDTNNASTGFPRVTLNAEDTSTTPSTQGNYAFSFGALTDSRFTGGKLVPDVTEAFVVRVDKDKVAHLYNSKALGLIDPSETNPVTASFTQDGTSFGNVTTWSWEAIGLHGQQVWPYSAGSGVYTNYIATIGAFDTDIGDQQCRALARLLAEKYQIS